MAKSNGELLLEALYGTLIDDGPELSPYSPVNKLAKSMGWGWHRTNNALKELGYR